jgi:hypothetical protein
MCALPRRDARPVELGPHAAESARCVDPLLGPSDAWVWEFLSFNEVGTWVHVDTVLDGWERARIAGRLGSKAALPPATDRFR